MAATANMKVVALAYETLWKLAGAENIADVDWLAAGTDNESADTLRVVTTDGASFTITFAPLNMKAMEA